MASHTFLENFLVNNRSIPELSQIYHHIYFKNKEGTYLAFNDSMLSFLGFPSHNEIILGAYGDKDLIKDTTSIEEVTTNDNNVLKRKEIQAFTELYISEKNKASLLSIKAPLYGENDLIGLCGISLSVSGYSLTDFNTILSMVDNLLTENNRDISKIALFNTINTPKFNLSPREMECLGFYMKGNTIKGISNILGLSNRTVEFYIENIKSKFGVNKRPELLSIAFKLYPELI